MAYPKIFRERALEALRKGCCKKEAARMFGLGENTLRQWEKLEEETGSLEKRPLDRKPRIDLEELQKYCEENPLATHKEAGLHFGFSERAVRYAKNLLGITRKKRRRAIKSEAGKGGPGLPKS